MTVRRNPITGDAVVFAPERAARPRAFAGTSDEARCPFCAGHEEDTPPELVRIGEPWRARVVPNKYPPLAGSEVIIESADHDATFDTLANAHEIVRLYADRVRTHADAAHVALFKNHGAAAGSSIPHVHSQLVPTPFVPVRIAREIEGFERASTCPLCPPIDGEEIAETETLRWLAPAASSMAYQQWIVPKRHTAAFTSLDERELMELATLLQQAPASMSTIASAYNWSFMSFPRSAAAHFYVDLFPRMTTLAGFELGTGTFVEIIDPAAAARRLRP